MAICHEIATIYDFCKQRLLSLLKNLESEHRTDDHENSSTKQFRISPSMALFEVLRIVEQTIEALAMLHGLAGWEIQSNNDAGTTDSALMANDAARYRTDAAARMADPAADDMLERRVAQLTRRALHLELISPTHWRWIQHLRHEARVVLLSGARQIHLHLAISWVLHAVDFVEYLEEGIKAAVKFSKDGELPKPMVVQPVHSSKVQALPYGMNEEQWIEQQKPLWNTAELELDAIEAADEEHYVEEVRRIKSERKQLERERKQDLARRAQILAKRRKAEKKAAKKAARLAQNDESANAGNTEDEKARKSVSFKVDSSNEEDERESEEDMETQDNEPTFKESTTLPSDELVELPPLPPPTQIHKRIPLSLRCGACRSVLADLASVQRIRANFIYLRSDSMMNFLVKDACNSWASEAVDVATDEPFDDMPDSSENSDNSHVRNSVALRCACCWQYVGRFFEDNAQCRLIYISQFSGENVTVFTGLLNTTNFNPILMDHEGDVVSDDDNNEDNVAANTSTFPPIVGVPAQYVSTVQAQNFPYPRFGLVTPYLHHEDSAMTFSDLNFKDQPQRMIAATANDQLATQHVSAAASPDTVAIGSMSPAQIASLMSSYIDAEYALPDSSIEANMNISMLMYLDRVFQARRSLDLVKKSVLQLFLSWPGPYHSISTPLVPLFTDFFCQPPTLVNSRGTARYIFHYLTGKDDSKLKRTTFTYKRFINSQNKYTASVWHFSIGGYGGMRTILIAIDGNYAILQSNDQVKAKTDAYTLIEWLRSGTRWSQVLNAFELREWLVSMDAARRGDTQAWRDLFTMGHDHQSVLPIHDKFSEKDVYYAQAPLKLERLL